MASHIRGVEAQKTGAWFTKSYLEKMYADAKEDYAQRVLPPNRRASFKVIRGEVFVWAGIPHKNRTLINKGMDTLHRQGFSRIRLIDGEFYVAR